MKTRQFIQITKYAFSRVMDDHLTQTAGSLTYTTVLAAVPLFTVILSIFTAFPIFDDFKIYLNDFLSHNLMPESISQNIMGYLNSFAQAASKLTAVGIAFLFVTSILLMMTIEGTLNKIWHVQQNRPLIMRILVYWAVLTLGPIALSASLGLSAMVSVSSLGIEHHFSKDILGFVFSMVLSTAGLSLLYCVVPNCTVKWRDALFGGFVAALLFEIIRAGFTFYITKFPSYTLIYGAFAAVPLFLLWIYISWLIVLFGAYMAAIAPDIRWGRLDSTSSAGTQLCNAVQILRLLHAVHQRLPQGLTQAYFIKQLKINVNQVALILSRLQALGYVVQADYKKETLWVLSGSDNADLRPLFDDFLFNGQEDIIAHDKALQQVFLQMVTTQDPIPLKTLMVE